MYGVGAASGSGCEPAGSSIGSSRTKRAPLSVSARRSSPPICAPARGRWPARGRSRSRPRGSCRARSARRSARDPRARRPDRRRLRPPWRSRRDRRAGRGRSRSPARDAGRCRAGCAPRGPRRSDRPAPARPGRSGDIELDIALVGAQLELGRHGAAQLAELHGLLAQRHVGVEPAEVEQLAGQPGQAPQLALGSMTWRRASSWSRSPARRSSSSSSIVPCSEVSGVRSSCEAVATNERRAASWRRSSRCIEARARARSPTSSRPSSRGVGASGPSSATRTAAARRRARRRPMPVASEMPSSTATSSPTAAAARNAVRTWRTAVLTSVSCFCVTSTKSPEQIDAANGVEREVRGHVDGLHDDDLVVAPDRARLGVADRGQDLVARHRTPREVGVDDRALIGHRLGEDHACVGALAQCEGAVLQAHAELVEAVFERLSLRLVEDRLDLLLKERASAVVAFSRSFAAWSVSRLCSGGSSARAATASVTTLVNTRAASSRGRSPKPRRLVTAPGSGSRRRGRSGSGSAPPGVPRASRADAGCGHRWRADRDRRCRPRSRAGAPGG